MNKIIIFSLLLLGILGCEARIDSSKVTKDTQGIYECSSEPKGDLFPVLRFDAQAEDTEFWMGNDPKIVFTDINSGERVTYRDDMYPPYDCKKIAES